MSYFNKLIDGISLCDNRLDMINRMRIYCILTVKVLRYR